MSSLFTSIIQSILLIFMQPTAIFHSCKNENFQLKFFDIFHILAQNIDCGYTLEPPHLNRLSEAVLTSIHNLCLEQKSENMYTPVNPSFTI